MRPGHPTTQTGEFDLSLAKTCHLFSLRERDRRNLSILNVVEKRPTWTIAQAERIQTPQGASRREECSKAQVASSLRAA